MILKSVHLAMAVRSQTLVSRRQRTGAISNQANAARKRNGTASLFSVKALSASLSATSKKAPSFTLKASCKHASGKTATAMIGGGRSGGDGGGYGGGGGGYNQDRGGYGNMDQGGGSRSASTQEGPKGDFDLDDEIPF